MHRSIRVLPLFALIAILLLAGIAATPAALTRPDQPAVAATSNAGELQVSWNRVPGAQHYTIGYANLDDLNRMAATGRNPLDAFYYVTIGAANTSHALSGLKPETAYYVLIGAQTPRFGATDLAWGPWSNAVVTAGQHGAGFCPITGLEIPTEGYLSVGDTKTWADGTLTLDSATLPSSLQTVDGSNYVPPEGRKFLLLCSTRSNQSGSDWYFQTGTHNNLSTDRGIGFAKVTEWGNTPLADGETDSACDAWSIPDTATVAVYAVDDGSRPNVLYRIDLSTISASSSSGTTAPSAGTHEVSQRHIDESGTCCS